MAEEEEEQEVHDAVSSTTTSYSYAPTPPVFSFSLPQATSSRAPEDSKPAPQFPSLIQPTEFSSPVTVNYSSPKQRRRRNRPITTKITSSQTNAFVFDAPSSFPTQEAQSTTTDTAPSAPSFSLSPTFISVTRSIGTPFNFVPPITEAAPHPPALPTQPESPATKAPLSLSNLEQLVPRSVFSQFRSILLPKLSPAPTTSSATTHTTASTTTDTRSQAVKQLREDHAWAAAEFSPAEFDESRQPSNLTVDDALTSEGPQTPSDGARIIVATYCNPHVFSARQLALLENPAFSDVTLVVYNNAGTVAKKIAAHRAILAAHSVEFRKMLHDKLATMEFEGPLPPIEPIELELHNVFVSDDADLKVFEDFIKYLYTGRMVISIASINQVLAISERFGTHNLRQKCVHFVCKKSLTHATCFDILLHGRKIGDSTLEKIGIKYIEEHFSELTAEATGVSAFFELEEASLCNILMSDHINVADEVNVFQAVLRWGKHQWNKRRHVDKATAASSVSSPAKGDTVFFFRSIVEPPRAELAEILKRPLEYVRFPLIPPSMLAQVVEPSGVVPITLLIEAYKHHALQCDEANIPSTVSSGTTPAFLRTRPRQTLHAALSWNTDTHLEIRDNGLTALNSGSVPPSATPLMHNVVASKEINPGICLLFVECRFSSTVPLRAIVGLVNKTELENVALCHPMPAAEYVLPGVAALTWEAIVHHNSLVLSPYTWPNPAVVGLAIDRVLGVVQFFVNGVRVGPAITLPTGKLYLFAGLVPKAQVTLVRRPEYSQAYKTIMKRLRKHPAMLDGEKS